MSERRGNAELIDTWNGVIYRLPIPHILDEYGVP